MLIGVRLAFGLLLGKVPITMMTEPGISISGCPTLGADNVIPRVEIDAEPTLPIPTRRADGSSALKGGDRIIHQHNAHIVRIPKFYVLVMDYKASMVVMP
jgi:hypothetical protein